MGYFSNGFECVDYQEQYCCNCVHDKNMDCPIWLAHLMYNSEGANTSEHILHLLIPRTKDRLGNEKCSMFIARGEI